MSGVSLKKKTENHDEPNITMNQLQELFSSFASTTLEEMDEKKLMNRVDTKYVFPESMLPFFLSQLKDDYSILVIKGDYTTTYKSYYYDTENLDLYHKHQRGKANRHKVRFRAYVESGINFFEIKHNTNKGRTQKERIQMDDMNNTLNEKAVNFLHKHTTIEAPKIQKELGIEFKRITLVNKTKMERVTFDTHLKMDKDSEEHSFNNLVIAEVKQDKLGTSTFVDLMKKERVHKGSVSKYCLGIISFHQGIKHNNFKPNLRHIKKIIYGNNATNN